MRVFRVSNKTLLIRHWLKWYTVERGAKDWRPLKAEPRERPFNINVTAKALQRKYGQGQSIETTPYETITEQNKKAQKTVAKKGYRK